MITLAAPIWAWLTVAGFAVAVCILFWVPLLLDPIKTLCGL